MSMKPANQRRHHRGAGPIPARLASHRTGGCAAASSEGVRYARATLRRVFLGLSTVVALGAWGCTFDYQGAVACSNGMRDGTETDIDCGGGSCLPCACPKSCATAADCR